MRPSSFEDEDISTTRTFSEGLPCSNTDEQDDVRRSLMETLVAMEILVAPVVVPSHHSTMKNLL
jgi:hypothetical protein